jgi:hypothetical protein
MDSFLGRVCLLPVARIEPRGALLEVREGPRGEVGHIPLPAAEVPAGTRQGQTLQVFVYLDSDDSPVATLRTPALVLGEVAFLRVVDVAPFGAFVDWNLPKDLLVPFKEQVRPMEVGERHPIALYVDDTGRLAGTARVSEFLQAGGDFELDEWVEGVVWREEPPLGTFVILERQYLGLLPATEFHRLPPGEPARFRIAHIHPDGKIEVSLRAMAYQELEGDSERLFDLLRGPNAPRLSDYSDPEVIRELLGISKKAFKRAAGRLLRRGVVTLDGEGCLRVREAGVAEPPPRGGRGPVGAAPGDVRTSAARGGGPRGGGSKGGGPGSGAPKARGPGGGSKGGGPGSGAPKARSTGGGSKGGGPGRGGPPKPGGPTSGRR